MRYSLINSFKCRLLGYKIIGFKKNNNQLFSILLNYRNCLKIYINDISVPKNKQYAVASYKETGKIKIKLVGLFNKSVHYLDVESQNIAVEINSLQKNKSFSIINTADSILYNQKSLICQLGPLASVKNLRRISNEKDLIQLKKINFKLTNNDYSLIKIINQYE